MKNLLFILFLIHSVTIGQIIPADVNTIVVKNVTFTEICNALLDSGYTIERKDSELQTARTEARQYPKYWNATYKVNVRVKDSAAYISATFTAPPEGGLFKDEIVTNQTTKKGVTFKKGMWGYIFLLLNDFALGFKKEVSYIKK